MGLPERIIEVDGLTVKVVYDERVPPGEAWQFDPAAPDDLERARRYDLATGQELEGPPTLEPDARPARPGVAGIPPPHDPEAGEYWRGVWQGQNHIWVSRAKGHPRPWFSLCDLYPRAPFTPDRNGDGPYCPICRDEWERLDLLNIPHPPLVSFGTRSFLDDLEAPNGR